MEIHANEKSLKLDHSFLEALKLIFLENPSYNFLYVKAIKDGKVVYPSISELKNKPIVECRDTPLPGYYEYLPDQLPSGNTQSCNKNLCSTLSMGRKNKKQAKERQSRNKKHFRNAKRSLSL